MSSQDLEGESYMADYIANPKVYGDVEHYGWTTEEEEDYDPKRKEETTSDEEDDPLPQPGDMHVELKKSSLPNKAKRSKVQFIPFRLLQECKQDLCKRVLELEQEVGELKEENSILKRKLRKKDRIATPSPPPSSSSPKEFEYRVWALPLASAKLGGGAPVSYHLHYLFAFTYFSSIFCFR